MQTMPDLSKVKRKPLFIDVLPNIGRNTGTAVYPYIFVSRSIYKDIASGKPNQYTLGLLLHEQEHLLRMKRHGVFKWYVQYFYSPQFRLEEELAASIPQFTYLKGAGLTIDLERKARLLSGSMYLWAGDHDTILKKLNKMWESA